MFSGKVPQNLQWAWTTWHSLTPHSTEIFSTMKLEYPMCASSKGSCQGWAVGTASCSIPGYTALPGVSQVDCVSPALWKNSLICSVWHRGSQPSGTALHLTLCYWPLAIPSSRLFGCFLIISVTRCEVGRQCDALTSGSFHFWLFICISCK